MLVYLAIPVSIFVIFTNLIVLLAILRSHKLQKLKNVPLTGLAIADILVGAFWIPFSIASAFSADSEIVCQAALSCEVFTMHASLFNLIAVSAERWTAIFRPLHYYTIANKTAVFGMVGAAWLASAIMLVLFEIQYKEVEENEALKCDIIEKSQAWYLVGIFVIFYGVCALTFFMQRKVFIVIRDHMTRIKPISFPRKNATGIVAGDDTVQSPKNAIGIMASEDIIQSQKNTTGIMSSDDAAQLRKNATGIKASDDSVQSPKNATGIIINADSVQSRKNATRVIARNDAVQSRKNTTRIIATDYAAQSCKNTTRIIASVDVIQSQKNTTVIIGREDFPQSKENATGIIPSDDALQVRTIIRRNMDVKSDGFKDEAKNLNRRLTEACNGVNYATVGKEGAGDKIPVPEALNMQIPSTNESSFIYGAETFQFKTGDNSFSQKHANGDIISPQHFVIKPTANPVSESLIEVEDLRSDACNQSDAERINDVNGNSEFGLRRDKTISMKLENELAKSMITDAKRLRNFVHENDEFYPDSGVGNERSNDGVAIREGLIDRREFIKDDIDNKTRSLRPESNDDSRYCQNTIEADKRVEHMKSPKTRHSKVVETNTALIHADKGLKHRNFWKGGRNTVRSKASQGRKVTVTASFGEERNVEFFRKEDVSTEISNKPYLRSANTDSSSSIEVNKSRSIERLDERLRRKSRKSITRVVNYISRQQKSGFPRAVATNIVCLAFIIMWAPKTTIDLLSSLGYCNRCSIAYSISVVLAWANSGVNALIYAWRMKEFRQTIMSMLSLKTRKKVVNRL